MRIIDDFEFTSKKLNIFRYKIWDEAKDMIDEIIKESPIQKGEIVDVVDYHPTYHPEYKPNKTTKKLMVTRIHLMISGKYSPSDNKYSYNYFGVPVKKDGITSMKNRKEINFNCFVKDGIEYHVPLYYRLRVVPATMYEFICGTCNRR